MERWDMEIYPCTFCWGVFLWMAMKAALPNLNQKLCHKLRTHRQAMFIAAHFGSIFLHVAFLTCLTGMAEHAAFCRKTAHDILQPNLTAKENFRLLRWRKQVTPKADSKWIWYVQAFPSQLCHLSLILTSISKILDYENSVAISFKIIKLMKTRQFPSWKWGLRHPFQEWEWLHLFSGGLQRHLEEHHAPASIHPSKFQRILCEQSAHMI